MIATALLAILAGVGYHALSPDERARLRRRVAHVANRLARLARQEVLTSWAAIRARPVVIAAPALAAVSGIVFLGMLFGRGALTDPMTLVAWGASLGPTTTNGAWWRLATSAFVPRGIVTLTVNAIALVEIGVLVERRVGRLALLAAFSSAAVLANVLNLWMEPLAVSSGASGGVCGVYGLLFALMMADRKSGSNQLVSADNVRRFVAMSIVILAVNIADDGVGTVAECAGVVTGFAFGLATARHAQDGARRVCLALVTAAGITLVAAATRGRIVDVRPEIQRLVELERRTATMYQASVGNFKKNHTNLDALMQVIEQTIVPALQEADARVKSLQGVPREERPRVGAAREYLRLRVESWSLRARGLRETSAPVGAISSAEADARYKASLQVLGRADSAERMALQLLSRISI